MVMVLQGTQGRGRRLGEAAELGVDASMEKRLALVTRAAAVAGGALCSAKNEEGEGKMARGEGGIQGE